MKTRNIIFGAVLSVLVSFALCQQLQAAVDTPDPGSVGDTNTADGLNALASNNAGIGNSGFGWFASWLNADGNFNTAVGAAALDLNNGFNDNTAVGAAAMLLSQGSDNTAVGVAALENNNADGNTATGAFALFANMTGIHNAAFGDLALALNTDSRNNTAVGAEALHFNDATAHGLASNNTAVGWEALEENIDAARNTAVGSFALQNNDSSGGNLATGNTAVGFGALQVNVDGDGNVAIGDETMINADAAFNTAVGFQAGQNLVASGENIYIGDTARTLDNTGAAPGDESGVIRIGSLFSGTTACFINGIFGNLTPGTAVFINAAGQLSTTLSARRFKKDIHPMDKTSEAIYSLTPVTFHYKSAKTKMPCFGLIAEEVAAVNPDLVLRDEKGEIVQRPLRADQCDVAQRVPQRAQKSAGLGSHRRAASERNGSSHGTVQRAGRANPESERPD